MSAISSLPGASSVSGTTSPDTVSGGTQQTLTQNDFLKLLVAQMQNQDPTNPQSDTAMAAQMAQFTSLTQSTAMSASLAMLQANSLIGSTVTVSTDSTGNTTSGVVQAIQLGSSASGSQPQILINGTPYNLSQVLSVSPTPTTPATAATTSSTPATSSPTTN
jgi:flagellar basal-body rod modification protein FlgD